MSTILTMQLTDYHAVMALMQQTPGVSIRAADSFDATARYLTRNPGLSFVAKVDDEIVGCIMSGHDGRRGYLQHLLVLPAHRSQGIARAGGTLPLGAGRDRHRQKSRRCAQHQRRSTGVVATGRLDAPHRYRTLFAGSFRRTGRLMAEKISVR